MTENTKIEWADHTFNPWMGCTKVSPGCAHCYAEDMMDRRHGRAKWGKNQPRVRTTDANWNKPLQWNRNAAKNGVRYRVFCASLADVFDEEIPIEWLADFIALIQQTPHLDWLLLTKRPENINGRMAQVVDWSVEEEHDSYDLASLWLSGKYPENVWLGTSVENQELATSRIPHLLNFPAAKRFLSCEPLLGPVDLEWLVIDQGCNEAPSNSCTGPTYVHLGGTEERCDCCLEGPEAINTRRTIDWVIIGGESGPLARPMALGWAKDLVRQCQENNVSIFVKQMGDNPTNREGDPCPHITAKKGNNMDEWP